MKSKQQKAQNIKAILLDVDGVLTDGGIIYDSNGNETKRFDVKDGQIVSHLKKHGFKIGVITGRNSKVVEYRCKELKFDFLRQGSHEKIKDYNDFKLEFGFVDEEIAYAGDDIPDLPILTVCGFSACPNDARNYIKKHVDFVTESNGGKGVLRDISDFILESQDLLDNLLEKYIKKD